MRRGGGPGSVARRTGTPVWASGVPPSLSWAVKVATRTEAAEASSPVGVGDDRGLAAPAAGHQTAQEARPDRAVVAGEDVDAQDLAVAVSVEPVATTLTTRPPSRQRGPSASRPRASSEDLRPRDAQWPVAWTRAPTRRVETPAWLQEPVRGSLPWHSPGSSSIVSTMTTPGEAPVRSRAVPPPAAGAPRALLVGPGDRPLLPLGLAADRRRPGTGRHR